jgi:hypothetical protein
MVSREHCTTFVTGERKGQKETDRKGEGRGCAPIQRGPNVIKN